MTKTLFAIAAIAATGLAACSPVTVARAPGQVAPVQFVTADGNTYWLAPAIFGPVPEALAAEGARVCGARVGGDGQPWQARGYHPRAVDLAGDPIPGGGFHCLPGGRIAGL